MPEGGRHRLHEVVLGGARHARIDEVEGEQQVAHEVVDEGEVGLQREWRAQRQRVAMDVVAGVHHGEGSRNVGPAMEGIARGEERGSTARPLGGDIEEQAGCGRGVGG